MTFQLDTSGRVRATPNSPHAANWYCWSDLTPFAHGFTEAAKQHMPVVCREGGEALDWGFRHLAPATVERIIADCAAGLADELCEFLNHPESGAMFWRDRQANQLNGMEPRFPPLVPYLSDDGLIMLREVGE